MEIINASTDHLWDHQKKGLQKALNNNGCLGLLFEPGTGKTPTAISIINKLNEDENKIHPTLIVTPKCVVGNFYNEFKKFSPHLVDRVCVLKGTTPKRQKMLNTFYSRFGRYFIIICNYDLLNRKKKTELLDYFIELQPEILVCDESQYLKNYKANRTKALIKISEKADHRILLSGTFMSEVKDVYTQFKILDQGATFGTHYWDDFFTKFYYNKNAENPMAKFPDWTPYSDSADIVSLAIQDKVLIAKKNECLDLPACIPQVIEIEMETKQRRIYEDIKKDFVATLDNDDYIMTDKVITKLLRLRQIATGYIKTEEGQILKFSPKMEALEEKLQILMPNKVLIWAIFKENYKDIAHVCNKLNIPYLELHGNIANKDTIINEFKNNDDYKVLIAHPQSGGVGINLTEAPYSIFYSQSYSWEDWMQSQARNYRAGQEQKVTHYYFVMNDSIEELIQDILWLKLDLSENVLKNWIENNNMELN